jgi:hypothetical protein
VILGWVLKTLADYFVLRRADRRSYNKATFFILRAWKLLKDYDRGTEHFRKNRPVIEQFEPWRVILADRFMEYFSVNEGTVSEAVGVLSEVDPAWATRLDNTIRTILITFRKDLAEVATTDAQQYAQLLYNQDRIIEFTLGDLAITAAKLSRRSGVVQRLRVHRYFRRFKETGDKEFYRSMVEQAEMLEKVTAAAAQQKASSPASQPASTPSGEGR